MFLTSKLITCFIDGFTSKRKSKSIAYLLMELNICIGFWTLTMECTQYGLWTRTTFRNPWVGPWSGFFDAAPARRPDACITHWGYLERPQIWRPTLIQDNNVALECSLHSLFHFQLPNEIP